MDSSVIQMNIGGIRRTAQTQLSAKYLIEVKFTCLK